MAQQGINIKGSADLQQIITALHQINGQVLALSNQIKKQGALTRKATTGHKQAATATKGHASAMKGLALRFVGYNLILNQVMGAQQKLVEFVKESITKYREFETRLAEISTILTEDKNQIDRFRIGIAQLAITYGQATSDISKGLYDIMSAAFDSKDAMNLLNTSIKASIAGLSDVRTSVDIFTSVLNAYGMTAEQATHVSDVLFQSVVRGKFQFADLEQALGYVVPIAAQAGIQFDELTAALSTATRHGLHLDMTARGLALAIQGIINPSEKATKAAMKYGVSMNGLSLRVLGLKGWFEQVGEAADKFGKGIIGELIPNMRSVRVAMVLAGEEGAKGFADDLKYLENVTGRTDIALNEIMKTQNFLAKQLEEKKAQIQRDIGEPWSNATLEIEDYILTVTRAIQLALPSNLPKDSFAPEEHQLSLWDRYKKKRAEVSNFEKDALIENYKYMDDYNKALVYMTSLKESSAISTELYDATAAGESEETIKSLNAELLRHTTIMELTQDAYNSITGNIQNVQMELARLETLLAELHVAKKELSTKLFDPVEYGTYGKVIKGTIYLEKERLQVNKNLADGQHDVDRAMIDSSHVWISGNQAVQDAVALLREHKTATDEDRKATEVMSAAMRELQIQTLTIQLAGMMRRRGLTRSEEKKMKQIQIEQAKLRLENMNAEKKQTEQTIDNYHEAQDIVNEFLDTLGEESYQMGYLYNQQMTDLDELIAYENEQYDNRLGEIQTTNTDIIAESHSLYEKLMEIATDPELKTAWEEQFDISIEPIIESALEKIRTALVAGGSDNPDRGDTGGKGDYGSVDDFGDKSTSYTVATSRMAYDEANDNWHVHVKSTSGTTKKWVYDKRNIARSQVNKYPIGKILNWKRGTERVPYDMIAQIHKGEKIIPAGRAIEHTSNQVTSTQTQETHKTVIENVTIEVQQVSDIDSVEKMSAALGAVKQAGVTDRMGRVKYRMM